MRHRAFLPFHFLPSQAVVSQLGREAERAAVLAVKAILRDHRQLEVAHQQIRYGDHHLAFSSYITGRGELVVELDVGDPSLEGRVILERELRHAERKTASERRRRGIA